MHNHLLDRANSVCGEETQAPGEDYGSCLAGVKLLQGVNAEHGRKVVSLTVSLISTQTLLPSQHGSGPQTLVQLPRQADDVTKAEIDSLASQRVDPVCRVSYEDSPGPSVPHGVTKSQGEGGSVCYSRHHRRSLLHLWTGPGQAPQHEAHTVCHGVDELVLVNITGQGKVKSVDKTLLRQLQQGLDLTLLNCPY